MSINTHTVYSVNALENSKVRKRKREGVFGIETADRMTGEGPPHEETNPVGLRKTLPDRLSV